MHQYILPFYEVENYREDEFIITQANKTAYSIISQWPNNFGVKPYEHTLLLVGPQSSGKTHIARLWQSNSKALKLLESIDLKEINNILNGRIAFLIEDIENWPESKLLHCFNLINEQHKSLLLTSSTLPKFALLDLASRINSLHLVSIMKPDDEMVKILLFKHFSDHSLKVPTIVIEYLLKILPRNYKEIIEAAKTIDEYAFVNKRNITIPLIKEALASLDD